MVRQIAARLGDFLFSYARKRSFENLSTYLRTSVSSFHTHTHIRVHIRSPILSFSLYLSLFLPLSLISTYSFFLIHSHRTQSDGGCSRVYRNILFPRFLRFYGFLSFLSALVGGNENETLREFASHSEKRALN